MDARKKLRLENFDYSAEGYYFITICTAEKEKILYNIVGDDAHIVPYSFAKIKSFTILATKAIGKSIFQRSFYDHIIRNENDYLKI